MSFALIASLVRLYGRLGKWPRRKVNIGLDQPTYFQAVNPGTWASLALQLHQTGLPSPFVLLTEHHNLDLPCPALRCTESQQQPATATVTLCAFAWSYKSTAQAKEANFLCFKPLFYRCAAPVATPDLPKRRRLGAAA